MWIRSQDKKSLIDAKCLYIKRYNHDVTPFCIADKNYDFQLGGYETQERAIEILDEIQKYLHHNNISLTEGNGRCIIKDGIYQMPEK